MSPTVPVLGFLAVHQPKIGFVNKGRPLQCLAGLLPAHFLRSQLPQFVVDERQELLRRAGVAGFDLRENARDVGHVPSKVTTPADAKRTSLTRAAGTILSRHWSDFQHSQRGTFRLRNKTSRRGIHPCNWCCKATGTLPERGGPESHPRRAHGTSAVRGVLS